nr:hypothetical protein [Tanacetum cinerariifolium]
MVNDGRDWMYYPRRLPEFEAGVNEFLDASFAKSAIGGANTVTEDDTTMHDNMDELLHDRFGDTAEKMNNVHLGLNEEAKKFYRLVEEGKQELFPGCKTFSKLSFVIRLLLYKTLHGLSNVAFVDLLKLLKEAILEVNIPANFTQAKSIVRDLGLDYEKIPTCPNNCMLYWDTYKDVDTCHICNASKWKETKDNQGNTNGEPSENSSKVPAKVVWHFPLKPMLQRLYMCSETAKHMTWYEKERPKDGNLRHPADGQSWKEFDSRYDDFAKEPRNVRLGSSSDGFNPFRTMSISHSTWLVVLVNYNLPLWMSMKPKYFMLSLLIPGLESPGNNIDVYLQPLIKELNDLWNDGLETYDKFKDETFKMYATLTWTISDFPRKTCYMDHRRFLDAQHPWRRNKSAFNGQFEERLSPKPLSGVEALKEVFDFENLYGKKQKKKNDSTCPWKKRSIFFVLPYWQFNSCRHNLDVMHIEKNICDNLIETLLDINGKTKDHAKARFDLLEMGIKERLQPQLSHDSEHVIFHKACFSMLPKEKDIFCRALKEAKLPYGCASNIAHCYRWMSFMERYLCKLKSYVRNKSRPEGSIAEGYLIEECLTLCSCYMHKGVKTKLNKGVEDFDSLACTNESGRRVFVNSGYPFGGKKRRKGKVFTLDETLSEQAHRYALFNPDCTEIDEYINEHQHCIDSQRRKSRWARAQNHSHQFAEWLKHKVINNNVPYHIFWLAKGPSPTSRRFPGYYVKGYRLHIKSRDDRCKTQNSGVSLTALTPSFASSRDKNPVLGNVEYYGRVIEIIELDYWSKFKVILFHCEWYQVEKCELGLSCVNFNKLCCSDDPFVTPSQVHQVFYVSDPIHDGLHYVVTRVPRDLFDFEDESSENVGDSYWCEPTENRLERVAQTIEHDTELLRKDIPPTIVDANASLADVEEVNEKSDESDYDDTQWDWMPGDEDNVSYGEKSNQDQSAPTHMTDYERSKLLRVLENQERLRQLGIKKIAKSLTSLVDSRKTKKTKKNPTTNSERDATHFHKEVFGCVGAAKTQHRLQFIVPLSMNKYANLAKQQIVAPNVSRILPFEEGCERHETVVDSNEAKKSRLQQSKEANERNRQFVDTSATKKNQSRVKVTMGELLLNIKGSQMQRDVLTTNATKPNSATTSISSGSRRKLIDEDGEDEDDLRYQDLNERDRDEVGYEDDENEDIENDLILHGVNEADGESVDDDENENIEEFENNNNETESDGSEDEFENEDVELEILQVPQSQKGTAISATKKKRPTMMHNIHTREFDRREVIICNEFGQPIGPSTKENDIVGKFSRFFGTIARTYSYCPLTYISWHKVPNKDRMWEYLLEKYIVPEKAKSHVLQSIGELWRGHKSRLKKKHFYDLKDNSARLQQRPKCISEKDFLQLLRLWNSKQDQKNKDPNKEPPSLTKMFERTRERKGHVYADTYDETERLIEQMKNYNAAEEDGSGEDGSASVDLFLAVMNKEELMESVRTDIDVELNRLVEMRKQIEDDHERKKLEIAEEHKRNKAELEDIRKEIEDQRNKLVEDAVKKLIQKLPPRVVREFLT